MAKVDIEPKDTFTVGPDRTVWQYRGGKCRAIHASGIDAWRGNPRLISEEDVSPAFAIGAMNAWGHEVVIVGEMPPSPEVTRRDVAWRDEVAVRIAAAMCYDDALIDPSYTCTDGVRLADKIAARAYIMADAMEAARKGGGR